MRVEAIMVPGGGRMGRFALLLAVLILGSSGVHGLEIWEIQGSGLRSDFENQAVTTNGNIVTAVGEGVFFIQSPNGRADGDPWTSDGVFVNHSGAPPVEVGDRVSLSGTVREYYGQTEIGGAVTVTVVSKDHPLPDIIDLDSSVPTADQPWPETELERFEGMRVRVAEGMITGPTDS